MKKYFLFTLLLLVCSIFTSRAAVAQDWIYYTKAGDTLWDLCLQYTAKRGCWKELRKYNDIENERTLSVGLELKIPSAWLLKLPIVGRVVFVSGTVLYEEVAGVVGIPLLSGQSLMLGSRITSEDGSARILLGTKDSVLIRPASVLDLKAMSGATDAGSKSELFLERGEVEVEVEPDSGSRFELHTPSAIAAVRGTGFRVVAQGETTRSEILEGLVAVQAATTQDVPAGYGLLAQQGLPLSEPRKLIQAAVFEYSRLDSPVPLTIEWSGSAEAVSWNLDIFQAGEAGVLVDSHSASETLFEVSVLPEGCYKLHVRGVDSEGFNGLEGQLPFCIEPLLPVVEQPRSYWDFLISAAIATLIFL